MSAPAAFDMGEFFPQAPALRPQFNLGCLHDIPNGSYIVGKHGESILNGGMAYITGTGGRGNTFKSVYTHWMNLTILDRQPAAVMNLYDTETTVTFGRLEQLKQHMPRLKYVDLAISGRIVITDNTQMSGNAWFDKLRKLGDYRKKNPKEFVYTTPFPDSYSSNNIRTYVPFMAEVDSFSMFITDSVEGIYDKNQIGDSGANTDSLRGAAAKSQMVMQLPTLTGQSGIYISLVMHMGDKHNLDPYAPQQKKLTFLKNGVTFKHVPEKISFVTNNQWFVMNAAPMQNKATKAPEFPKDSSDKMEGDTDLFLLNVINLRAKNGPTGMPFELIVSQSEGLLTSLSEFWYCKSFDRFGLGGNDRNYYFELYPDCNLSRTSIRGKFETDDKLRRAAEITSELCQMKNLWDDPDGLWLDPKTLYETLKDKYDWNVLLEHTRGYWVFEEFEDHDPLQFLSTRDLLNMAKGTYHPWWYDDFVKNLPK